MLSEILVVSATNILLGVSLGYIVTQRNCRRKSEKDKEKAKDISSTLRKEKDMIEVSASEDIVITEKTLNTVKCAFFGSKFGYMYDGSYPNFNGDVEGYLRLNYKDELKELRILIDKMVKEKGVNHFILTGQYGLDLLMLCMLRGLKKKGVYPSMQIDLALPYKNCYSAKGKNKDFNEYMLSVINASDVKVGVVYVDEVEGYEDSSVPICVYSNAKIQNAVYYAINHCDYFVLKVDRLKDDKKLATKFIRYAKSSEVANIKSIIDVYVE